MKKILFILLFLPATCFASFKDDIDPEIINQVISQRDSLRSDVQAYLYMKIPALKKLKLIENKNNIVLTEEDWRDIEHIMTQIKGRTYGNNISNLKDKIDLLEMRINKLELQIKEK